MIGTSKFHRGDPRKAPHSRTQQQRSASRFCNPLTRAVGLSALHRPWRGSPWLGLKHSQKKSHLHTPSAGRATSWKSRTDWEEWGRGGKSEHISFLSKEPRGRRKVWLLHYAHFNYFILSSFCGTQVKISPSTRCSEGFIFPVDIPPLLSVVLSGFDVILS